MKYLILIITSLLTVGCMNIDTVDLRQKTEQINDLNDKDRDGVIEAREKCADTYVGSNIDNYGCSSVKRIDDSIELNVNFSNDSSIINSRDYVKIEEVAVFMKKFGGSHVTIEGHSSRQGGREYNQRLSEKRAIAVARLLTSRFDIPQFRVSAVGFGFDKPIDDSNTSEAHALNRRIVATLSGTEQSTAMKWTIYTVDDE
ncbi:MAG: OmpA family protein [Psychrobium sp.]|nr:OmpA family protein [Psychrobium sp.]